MGKRFFNPDIETLDRANLDALVEERIRYTVGYAEEHSPFYRRWFREHGVKASDIRTHEDLLELPIITGETIREHQPPSTPIFDFKSAPDTDIFTIHETSGTSGVPKSFFLTWGDWERYAEKYARIFASQGFAQGDRVVVCASYGMNVGANTMTLAARDLGITIVPAGRCTFPSRVIENYRPTGIVGSIFKLLRLARRVEKEGLSPQDSGVKRLVVGGESFAEESRRYLSEIWGCPVYNSYGSTEGTMCGECTDLSGLHVPEDMAHLDVYDPGMEKFVRDGECGRMVLTTLLPVGARAGTLLLNYDTEDTTVVVTRDDCPCGRTHMKIMNPQREAETFWVQDTPFNRVDVEKGAFQPGNMEYITGEYEAVLSDDKGKTILSVSMESERPAEVAQDHVEDNFLKAFLEHKPGLSRAHGDGKLDIRLAFKAPRELDIFRKKGRPKRVVDMR